MEQVIYLTIRAVGIETKRTLTTCPDSQHAHVFTFKIKLNDYTKMDLIKEIMDDIVILPEVWELPSVVKDLLEQLKEYSVTSVVGSVEDFSEVEVEAKI